MMILLIFKKLIYIQVASVILCQSDALKTFLKKRIIEFKNACFLEGWAGNVVTDGI